MLPVSGRGCELLLIEVGVLHYGLVCACACVCVWVCVCVCV